jgi:hypothetical protein
VASLDDIWLPLVDEPIGGIIARLETEEPELELVARDSPRRLLAFRTFAYIRVGIVLGQLLFEDEIEPYDGSKAWVEALLGNPAHRQALVNELRATAEEIAADPRYAGDEPLGPDEGVRERFREFARRKLGRN